MRDGERIVRMGERGDEQERAPVVRPRDVEDRALGGEGDLVVEVELVGAHADAGLGDRAHVVIPARPFVGMVPVGRPAEIGGVDVGRQPFLEAMQLVRPAEVHLAGEDGAVAAKPQVMGEGRDVGGEFRGVVVDAGARRQAARS